MNISETALKSGEKALFALRELYARYGYTPYKMNKFEEYDLYVRNKDFLISDSVITFTDTNGRLMALKPDVTLSIVKNGRDVPGGIQKVYYNENVYRVSESSHGFREIMQTGLECIGDVDEYCLYEVIMLAAESLRTVAPDWVLDISHLGVLSGVLEEMCLPESVRGDLLRCVGEKNLHELAAICTENGVNDEKTALLSQLLSLYGTPAEVLPRLRALLGDVPALNCLETVIAAFDGGEIADRLRIDFSVVSDTKYYNGFVFKGFINGVPDSVLSGGQYDNLMRKMGRRSGAIGFAVYLDRLERLSDADEPYDVDAVLLYDARDLKAVKGAVAALAADGKRVMAVRAVPEKRRYRQLWKLKDGEVELLENNA